MLCCWSIFAKATSVTGGMELSELVKKSDFILVGRAVEIKIYDSHGKEVAAENAHVGPGTGNKMYYYISINESETLKSMNRSYPATYKALVWEGAIRNLTEERELFLNKKVVLFLKGNNLEPASQVEYLHVGASKETIEEIKQEIAKQKES
jgi:hypothetical protein